MSSGTSKPMMAMATRMQPQECAKSEGEKFVFCIVDSLFLFFRITTILKINSTGGSAFNGGDYEFLVNQFPFNRCA